MKCIVCGDLHLKLWSDKEYTTSGLPLKLMEILATVNQMAEYAKKNGITHIIVAGDINDTKGMVSVRAFVLFRQLIESYPDITWIIAHGNHDATTGDDRQEHSAIQLLDGLPNVQLVLEPSILPGDENSALVVPHSKDVYTVLQNLTSDRDPEDTKFPKVLISHFGLDEAQLTSGISIRAGIKARDLRMFPLVVLGHYHTPQIIETEYSNIYYVGSPIPVRRDEALEEKRFLIVDIDTLEVVSVPTDGYRRYCELVLNEDTDPKEFEALVLEKKSQGFHVVIRKTIADIPLDLKEVVSENAQVIDMYEKDITIRGITSSMGDQEQARKYLEIMGIAENEIEEYLKIAMEIVTTASED